MLGLIETALIAASLGIGAAETLAATAPAGPALRPEVQIGSDAPLGGLGLALVYGPRPWFSLGAGVGFDDQSVHYGLFVRTHLLRVRGLAIGPVVTASLGDRQHLETYERPQYTPDHLRWAWSPAYRLDVGLGAELQIGRVTARLEGGLGYVFNTATCQYSTETTFLAGDCNGPDIPAYYHFARPPGTVARYLALSLGMDTRSRGSAPGAVSADAPATDRRWYGGPAVVTDVIALALAGVVVFGDEPSVFPVAALAYGLGAPINHALHRHGGRALGSLGIRALAALASLGLIVSAYDNQCYTDNTRTGSCGQVALVPVTIIAAMVIDDAFLARGF